MGLMGIVEAGGIRTIYALVYGCVYQRALQLGCRGRRGCAGVKAEGKLGQNELDATPWMAGQLSCYRGKPETLTWAPGSNNSIRDVHQQLASELSENCHCRTAIRASQMTGYWLDALAKVAAGHRRAVWGADLHAAVAGNSPNTLAAASVSASSSLLRHVSP